MKEQVIKECINKMFEMAGYDLSFNDIKDRKDNWYQQYTMNEAQNTAWRNWCTNYIYKKLRIPKQIAEREADSLDLIYGLKIQR